ncbi:hypothetical protein HMPREF9318_00097 [Streptococcus urinalis FB127-CNA-2]|uniref:Uncharacterized protein n=1 Tax=Streptococcus urinalis 2285-97 TaxID=764291 RepID=G5KEK1_9STRE|nr:phage tail tube assembly chaperone [Streptococcus urinalis]QBX22159.1 tail assembly protein [Streptococcus phage Javan637]QBX31615.1 tail assembly protein [Streptococcus phage Javan642]QBX31640.1 tail assembly protein [Streptococcus phage Javan648]EHJ56201.1 hypothetical protein STRUR_0836 [Streptococcus urinalis 2285-97]EKS21899.1 hypothetical protein HMPREF9318_00097 [Streptococcus urinalis FB127-CNA-2]
MEIKTIKIPEIDKKPFQVLTSNRNVMRMHKYQLAVLKASDGIDEEDTIAQADASYHVLNEMLSFIRSILNLDDKAYEKLLDIDYSRTQEISEKLVGYMYGLTDKQLEEASGIDDPKKEVKEA